MVCSCVTYFLITGLLWPCECVRLEERKTNLRKSNSLVRKYSHLRALAVTQAPYSFGGIVYAHVRQLFCCGAEFLSIDLLL